MTTNQQIKAPMHAPKVSPDSGALQGARRATEDAPESAPAIPPLASDTEVVPRARRRTFTKADKRRILHEADQCTKPGQLGALMRREAVYSSSLSTWRRQLEAADLQALAPKKRGPKAAGSSSSRAGLGSGSGSGSGAVSGATVASTSVATTSA